MAGFVIIPLLMGLVIGLITGRVANLIVRKTMPDASDRAIVGCLPALVAGLIPVLIFILGNDPASDAGNSIMPFVLLFCSVPAAITALIAYNWGIRR